MAARKLQPRGEEIPQRFMSLGDTLMEARWERDVLRSALLQMPALVLLLRGRNHIIEVANQPWLDSVGRRDVLGKPLHEVMPEIAGQGFFDLLDRVFTTGETFVGSRMPVDLDRTGTGVLERRWYTFHYIAHRAEDGEVIGVLVHAADVTNEVMMQQEVQSLDAKRRTFFALAENAPDGILVTEEGRIVYANPAFNRMLGYGGECVGQHHIDLLSEESREAFQRAHSKLPPEESWQGNLTYLRSDGSRFLGQVSTFGIPHESSEMSSEGCIVRDMTAELRQAVQEQVIAMQEREIRELSTPLIPLAEGLVVMPLVGTINGARAAQIMETLLSGVAAQSARIAILDITGVKAVDGQVAAALLRTAQAAALLGTEVVLTGIGPHVARMLVEIGADLGKVKTRGTLQSAVAYAMGRSAPRAW